MPLFLSSVEIMKSTVGPALNGRNLFLGEVTQILQFDGQVHVVNHDRFGCEKHDGRKIQNGLYSFRQKGLALRSVSAFQK